MTRRKLTEEEIDLWKKVAKQTERLQPDKGERGADQIASET